jgi:hypothetical protein
VFINVITILSIALFLARSSFINEQKDSILSQIKKIENFVKISPYQQTLTWDRKKIK